MNGQLKVFTGLSHPSLANEICGLLEIEPGKRATVRFSNENLLVRIGETVRGCDVFVVQTQAPPVHEGFFELLMMVRTLRQASAGHITVVAPYFWYARSDKEDTPRVCITARLVADLLAEAGANSVLTMDLHSPQIQGFFGVPMFPLSAIRVLCDYMKGGDLTNTVLAAGDAGGVKKLGGYAKKLKLPMAIVNKQRDGDDENPIAVGMLGDVRGKTCILVDDEVASGRTLVRAAELLLQEGAARVEAVCVHPVLSGDAVQCLSNSAIARLIVTNTIPTDGKSFDKLEVVSVAPLLAEAIKRTHDGKSVHELCV